jgi:hypothetical protein
LSNIDKSIKHSEREGNSKPSRRSRLKSTVESQSDLVHHCSNSGQELQSKQKCDSHLEMHHRRCTKGLVESPLSEALCPEMHERQFMSVLIRIQLWLMKVINNVKNMMNQECWTNVEL